MTRRIQRSNFHDRKRSNPAAALSQTYWGVYLQAIASAQTRSSASSPNPAGGTSAKGHNLTSPFVNLAQAATYEGKSAENPANFRPYRWGTGGEPLPQKQHKKAAKARRIAR
jgi:hypothetical protein